MNANKNKDKNAGVGANASISAANVNKNKDDDNSFGNVIMGEIDKNAKKLLKMSKSKLFVAIINCKKSYL